MAFVSAMNSPDNTKVGVNGANVYTEDGVEDYRVSLFTMLNRDLEYSYMDDSIQKIVDRNIDSELCDLFVMAFQTRDIRGGKGEKELFYKFIDILNKHKPDVMQHMIRLIPEYGCWRDLWVLMRKHPNLSEPILEYVQEVFASDTLKSTTNKVNEMSLLAKWLPRESSGTYPGLARKIANHLFKECVSSRERIVRYRKEVSHLNKLLKTIEINMCGREWKDICPEHVPGRCMKNNKKAFLNEPREKNDNNSPYRYPDSEDRMQCRTHFLDFIEGLKKGTKKVHGANVVMPHELVQELVEDIHLSRYNYSGISSEESAIIEGQWVDILQKCVEGGGLRKCVPMCDFSGSMNGLPKMIALALGILISEVNHDSFKDHILTFDSDPKWHSFKGKLTLRDKLKSISSHLAQGLNTNFYKACMMILDKMKKHKVPVGEEPEDLVVLTDMGWDDASKSSGGAWETQVKQIRDAFKMAGEEIWGEGNGWKPPRIVIWNLRAEYKDFHAKAGDEGVIMLSGWSPSLFKVMQTKGIQSITPYQGLRSILDDPRYDPVRHVWNTA